MPLTFSSPLLDDIEARRKRQAELTQASQGASAQAMQGLQLANVFAQKQRADERQKTLDDENRQYRATELRFKESADKRAAEDQTREGAKIAEEQRRYDEAQRIEGEGRTRKLHFEDEDRARRVRHEDEDRRRAQVPAVVAAGIARGMKPEDIAAATGMPIDDVLAEHAKQAKAVADTDYERKFGERVQTSRERDAAAQRAIERDRIAAQREAARLAADAAAGKAAAPKPLEGTTVKALASYDASLERLGGLLEKKKGVDTGPIASRLNSVAQVFGVDDAEVTGFKADLANEMNETISRLSGANVPPAEFERLRQGMPQATDNDGAFLAKLQSTIGGLKAARKYLVEAEGAAGRDVSGFAPQPPPAAPPSANRARADAVFGGW